MKKILLVFFLGFICAQSSEYVGSTCVYKMQERCYSLWTKGNSEQYQKCMDKEKTLNTLSKIFGFNFIYFGRKIIYGY